MNNIGLGYNEKIVYDDYYRLRAIGLHKDRDVRYGVCHFCLCTFDETLSWWDCAQSVKSK